MRYKATFVIGFAAGYTLGAKAGRERYEQIMRAARGLSESPTVQSAAGVLQAQETTLVGRAKQAVVDRLPLGDHDSYTSGPGLVPATPTNGRATACPAVSL